MKFDVVGIWPCIFHGGDYFVCFGFILCALVLFCFSWNKSVGWRKEWTKRVSDSHRQMHGGQYASLILNLPLQERNPERGEGMDVCVRDISWTCTAQRWAFVFTDTLVEHSVSREWVYLIVVAPSLMVIMNFTPFAIFFLEKFSFTTAVQVLVRFTDININIRICFGQHLMSRRLWQLCYIFLLIFWNVQIHSYMRPHRSPSDRLLLSFLIIWIDLFALFFFYSLSSVVFFFFFS